MRLHELIEEKKVEVRESDKIAKLAAIAVTVGTSIGVAVSVLVALKSDKEAREDIKNNVNEVKENVKNKTVVIKKVVDTKVEEGKAKCSLVKEKVIEFINKTKDTKEDIVEEEVKVENQEVVKVEVQEIQEVKDETHSVD